MGILEQSFSGFTDIFKIFWLVFYSYHGWLIFVLGVLYMLYFSYKHEIMHQFVHQTEWVFLFIKAPKTNTASTLAVEAMFSQMHYLFSGKTFAEKYIEGQIQLWYSMEIVSMGGKISFVVRLPSKVRDLFEAAMYSHYPDLEIHQVSDYMANINYDEQSEFDVFGSEMKLVENDSLPIKTYKDFEHMAAEEKVVDPLANLFESMGKIEPHEFLGLQILLQPIADEDWKEKSDSLVKKLIGEEEAHHGGFFNLLMAPFEWVANFRFSKLFEGGSHGHGEEKTSKNNWQNMTDVEKERVNLIQKKMSKPGYKTKMRLLYIAPKSNFNPAKRNMVYGAFRILSSGITNKFKHDGLTMTHVDYQFSPSLEQKYINWRLKKKKHKIFKGYKDRDIHIGRPGFILNTEEVATIFHFPITGKESITSSSIERMESKKTQAPANLPVLEEE